MRIHKVVLSVCLLSGLAGHPVLAGNYKVQVDSFPPSFQIVQVDTDEYSTLISFTYQNSASKASTPPLVKSLIWSICIDENTVLKAPDGREYHLLTGINLPVSNEAEYKRMCIDKPDQRHQFLLEFERLDDDIDSFDIIEDEFKSNAFNFHGIKLQKEEDREAVNINSFIKDFPVKEYGWYYSNDSRIQYYSSNGAIIQVRVAYSQSYGTYYSAAIDFQNLTGKSILFSINNIKAYALAVSSDKSKKTRYRTLAYTDKGGDPSVIIPENLYVFSANEYDKKIATAQTWAEVFAGLASSAAAATAGYSSSSTTVNGTVDTDSAAAAAAIGTNGYGFAVGVGTSHTSIYGTSRTQSYNGAAAYWAQRQAAQDLAELSARNYQIRTQLTDGYIKRNSIKNEQEYSGFCNIEHINADVVILRVTIGADNYDFPI